MYYIKQKLCKHREYYEGWFVQQVRFRECAKCGLIDIQDPHVKTGYKILYSGKNITNLKTE